MIVEDAWFKPTGEFRERVVSIVKKRCVRVNIAVGIGVLLALVGFACMQTFLFCVIAAVIPSAIVDSVSYTKRTISSLNSDLYVYVARVSEICELADYTCVVGQNGLVVSVSDSLYRDLMVGDKLVIIRWGAKDRLCMRYDKMGV